MPANFILKFQATDEKTAKKILGGFSLPHLCVTQTAAWHEQASILILVYALLSRTIPLTPSLYLVSETHSSPEFLDSLFLHPAVSHPHTEKTRST